MGQTPCPLAGPLAERLRDARAELTRRWLERIVDRVDLDHRHVFPTDELLDHIPLLLVGIADHIEDPADTITADATVVFHARELGALRHRQGFNEYEILKEFELLGNILFTFAMQAVEEIDVECSRAELLGCGKRLFHAVLLIQQATTTRFLELAKARSAEREERLRAFHRALTHEMRNRIGATLGAGQLLQMGEVPEERKEELAAIVVRNADSMRLVLDNLLELARIDPESRQERHVTLRSAVTESIRQLRETALASDVEVRLDADLPDVDVNAAAVELCLSNLLSNAIKYADREKPARWIHVDGELRAAADGAPIEVIVRVRDNGIGVPGWARTHLFERFFRAHESALPDVDGTGLGLNLVRDAIEAIGGRVWGEFSDEATLFAFAMPCRRASDAPSRRDNLEARVSEPG